MDKTSLDFKFFGGLEELGRIEIDREMGTVSWVGSEIEEGKSLKTNPG